MTRPQQQPLSATSRAAQEERSLLNAFANGWLAFHGDARHALRMKLVVTAAALATSLVMAAQSQRSVEAVSPADSETPDWSAWTRPLAPSAIPTAVRDAPVEPRSATEEIDVVDAHWMALIMWGEARGGGEDAMRAVGHVIDNRRRSGLHGAYATETVSEAFQFSCWNRDDPNREAMMNVDSLDPKGADGPSWLAARRIAGEILSGRSDDPTGGALFYHDVEVTPRWSSGIPPTRLIGGHLFFRAAAVS